MCPGTLCFPLSPPSQLRLQSPELGLGANSTPEDNQSQMFTQWKSLLSEPLLTINYEKPKL